MKPLTRLFALLAAVTFMLTSSSVRTVHAATACVVFEQTNFTGSFVLAPFTAKASAAYTWVSTAISAGGTNFTFNFPTGGLSGPAFFNVPAFSKVVVIDRNSDCSLTWTHFTDGRLNDGDAFETSAIYCLGDGSVRVYVIGDPLWTIAFDASPAEIAKVPKHPAQNTLIKSAHGAALYRLTSGLLQVNSPGLNPVDGAYHFAFEDCPLPKK